MQSTKFFAATNICINQGAKDATGDGPGDKKHEQKVTEQRDADPEDIANSNLEKAVAIIFTKRLHRLRLEPQINGDFFGRCMVFFVRFGEGLIGCWVQLVVHVQFAVVSFMPAHAMHVVADDS